MATVIESSVWVDFFRSKTPPAVKQQIKPWVLRPDLALCDPVVFELLRSAASSQRQLIKDHFATIPKLPSPPELWDRAVELGQRMQDAGATVGSIDLLISTLCIHHRAELICYDTSFAEIARVSSLKLNLLTRPS